MVLRLLLTASLIAAGSMFAVAFAQNADEQPLLLSGARLFIGDGNVIERGEILLSGGVIREVAAAGEVSAPPSTRRIDVSGKTIIPALIDAHAHLGYQGRGSWGADNYSVENLIDNLKQYAYYGFGAVFSAGSDPLRLVDSVNNSRVAGEFVGARLLYAAGMAPPGEGPNNQFLAQALAVERANGTTILYGLEDPQQARESVREVAQRGYEFIKIWVDDRGGSQRKLSPALYRAVIAEARNLGIRVFVHQQAAADMPELLAAGAHGFLHGRMGDGLGADIARHISRSGAFIVPNLGLAELRREAIGEDRFLQDIMPASVAARLSSAGGSRRLNPEQNPDREAALRRSFAHLTEADVDIVLGTDAGAVPDHPFGYTGHRELEIYVRLGMSPRQALSAATGKAARHLGLDDTGLLQTGYTADLLVLDADPLEDIRNTRAIHAVYLGGELLDREALRMEWAAQ